jgi:hypothetical protein
MTSPVVPNIATAMGAILTIGTVVLIPLFGPSHLARQTRTIEEPVTRATE